MSLTADYRDSLSALNALLLEAEEEGASEADLADIRKSITDIREQLARHLASRPD